MEAVPARPAAGPRCVLSPSAFAGPRGQMKKRADVASGGMGRAVPWQQGREAETSPPGGDGSSAGTGALGRFGAGSRLELSRNEAEGLRSTLCQIIPL